MQHVEAIMTHHHDPCESNRDSGKSKEQIGTFQQIMFRVSRVDAQLPEYVRNFLDMVTDPWVSACLCHGGWRSARGGAPGAGGAPAGSHLTICHHMLFQSIIHY